MGEKNLVDSTTENALIKKVELYSVGGLCEPDLTGSCHVFIVTYTNKEKILFIIDAGAFQKASSAQRNALFDAIFQTAKPGCMIASHGHLDHMGRFVLIFKGVMAEHGIDHLPVLMSQATRHLLPAILNSYHQDKKDSVSSLDDSAIKFWHEFERFFRIYTKRPQKFEKSRTNHKPYEEIMRELRETKASDIGKLENEFIENGGRIEKKILLIPKDLSKSEKKVLYKILKEVDRIKKDTRDKLGTEERKIFPSVEGALSGLFLGDEIEEEFRKMILDNYIPRQNRNERGNKRNEIYEFISGKIDERRRTLLPEVTEEDIGILVRESQGLLDSVPHPLSGVPGVTMTLHPTGHMLGAVSIELEFNMVKDKVKRILVSGDVGSWEKPTIHGVPQLPQKKADIVIMETTNAGKIHPEVEQSVKKMIEFIRAKKGPIIMPVFAIDRMHVVLHIFGEMIRKGEFPCPIYWRNKLGDDTLNTYLRYLPQLKDIFSKITPLNGENDGGRIHRMMESDEHCIVIGSGGCLQSQSTAGNLVATRTNAGKELFLLMTGYQPAGLGQKIMEAVQAGNDPEEILEFEFNCETIETKRGNVCLGDCFSGHGDQQDLSRFAQSGDEHYLIHGNPKRAGEFAESIGGATIIKPNMMITLLGK